MGSIRTALLATAVAALTFSCASVRVPDDDVIVARVKSALGRTVPASATNIKVTSDEGKVTLTGYVESPDAALRAVEAARSIEGVKTVESDLKIATLR